MPPNFAVVVCHGSYHTPEPYQPFLDALKANGIEAYCPQLPSSDLSKLDIGDVFNPNFDRNPPEGGYPQPADDTKIIQELLQRLIEGENKNVILIGHSSGGFTAALSAIPKYQAKNRARSSGGIFGVFYACGFVVPVGESVHTFFQPKDGSPPVVPPYCKFHVSLCNSQVANHI